MYRLNDRVYAKLCVCASLRAYSLRNIKSMPSRKGAIVCASHWLVCSFDACSCVSGQDRRTQAGRHSCWKLWLVKSRSHFGYV